MRAALDLFVDQGFAATRIQEIADRAGVSKGTIYLYFESKEALLEAVVRDAMGMVIEHSAVMIGEASTSASDLMLRLLKNWWASFESSGATGLPKLIYSECANYPKVAEFYMAQVQEARLLFERVIEQGVASGEFRPVHAPSVVKLILGQVVFAMVYKHSLARFDPVAVEPDRFLELLVDMYLGGLCTRSEESSTT